MPTVTVAVPEDLKRKMDEHDTINWSGVARKAFEKQLADLAFFEKIAKKSDMTEEDAIKLGRELKKGTYEKYYAPRLERERPLRSNHKERGNTKAANKSSS